jgi:hypothetical protein
MRVRPLFTLYEDAFRCFVEGSICLGMQILPGGKLHLKLNTSGKPIANKYREGKIQRTSKRELKST